MKETFRIADAWVEILVQRGVDTVFGVPGGPAAAIFDALLLNPKIKLLDSRHESAAVYAAMGYYRATGKMAAVAVSAGPGVANALSGISAAYFEMVPLLFISGDVPWIANHGRLLQSLGPEGMNVPQTFQAVTREVVVCSAASRALEEFDRALHLAKQKGRLGPVMFVAPLHIAAAEISPPSLQPEPVFPTQESFSSSETVYTEITEKLTQAKRPVVFVGAAATSVRMEILKFCENHGIPFMTTPRGKGMLPEKHALSLRNGGMAASWWARHYITEVDAALVIGTDLDDVSIGVTPPTRNSSYLAHVDLNPSVFGRNLPVTRGLCQEFSVFMEELLKISNQKFKGTSNTLALSTLQELKKVSPFDEPDFKTDSSMPMAPHRVLGDLQTAMGERGTLVTDIGEHMLFGLHYWTAQEPNDFLIHLGLGAMGGGIGSSIGFAYANKKFSLNRKVVCLCGDGGIQMSSWEPLLALKEKIPMIYAIMNDGRYNMVKHGFQAIFSREILWDMPLVDFALWAKSFGMAAARIDQPGQITANLLEELTLNWTRAAILDLRCNPEVRIRGAGRNESIKQMSVVNEAIG